MNMRVFNMSTYKIVFLFCLLGFSYSQTGFFVDKNTSAFGVWGDYNTATDSNCDHCSTWKTIRFDYLTPYNLEISVGKRTVHEPGYYYYNYNSPQVKNYIPLPYISH